MPRWKWMRAGWGRGRPAKPIMLGWMPNILRFGPKPGPPSDFVRMEPPELEVLRLVDLLGYTQEEAGKKMGVSRGTVWRLLESARKKVADAIVNGKDIIIELEPKSESP